MNYKQIKNYDTAMQFLNGKNYRRIFAYLEICKIGENIIISYRNTSIVIYMPDNKIRLFANGWKTLTTKRYMNLFAGEFVNVWQKDYQWYFLPKQYPSVVREFLAYEIYII